MKKFILGFALGILLLLIAFLLFFSKEEKIKFCGFEISDVKEYKGEYYPGNYYIVYEGVISNTSDRREYLNGMIAKVYNDDNILITDGYYNINEWIDPGKSTLFKINNLVDTNYNTVVKKYFNKDTEIFADIYPWFETCR